MHFKRLNGIQEGATASIGWSCVAKSSEEQSTDWLVFHDEGMSTVDLVLQVQAQGDVRELKQLTPLLAPSLVDVRPALTCLDVHGVGDDVLQFHQLQFE